MTTEQGSLGVLIVDDSPVVRTGLRALIGTEPDLAVVGEASNGDEAIRMAAATRPDVVLLDVRMPRRDGLSVVAELAGSSAVLMLTFTDDPSVISQALSAGAVGYLVHGTFDASALSHMIRGAAAGVGAFSGPALAALRTTAQVEAPSGLRDGGHSLSPRQVEVMDLVAEGRSNSDIARTLFVAEKTVKNHINQIFASLCVSSRAEAIAAWVGLGKPAANLGPSVGPGTLRRAPLDP
ncbi:LuxR family two component transcriptional regulator [Branchiibius hedensis]|uniref:DNA-binding response regulator, NarL/FixJ family, contains REC and HTH domains n=1 Tax=Branchiibius hedensis TaxID=672460 RepID=A0A2Y8ZUP7_9MICO|nr:response regulator transcription factor [Branchiibius hedensis]PWJ26414.1 LuxR family two component transcriptional regulator [Branchiibius hedensis]SSA35226.1 DNA-binding response regulator, NarL/FixJ family, contains REC and HTH domains [Branchiibius hedensis]